jgi:ABC-type molybdate transport system substrate-binding protein
MGAPGGPVPYTLVGSELHAPLRQAAGVVTGSGRPEFAQVFLDLVLSPEGQEIMARFGFEPPPSP